MSFAFSICHRPPTGHNTLDICLLMADTAYDFPCMPSVWLLLHDGVKPCASLTKPMVRLCFLIEIPIISIYRCATATLPLRNSKVYVAQQQPCRPAAVNNFAMVLPYAFTIVCIRKAEKRCMEHAQQWRTLADMDNRTQCPPLSMLYTEG